MPILVRVFRKYYDFRAIAHVHRMCPNKRNGDIEKCFVVLKCCYLIFKYLYYPSGFGAANLSLIRKDIRVRLIRSICPLAFGIPVVVKTCWMFSCLQYSAKFFAVKNLPRSEIIPHGLSNIAACRFKLSSSYGFHHIQPHKLTRAVNYNEYTLIIFFVDAKEPKLSIW